MRSLAGTFAYVTSPYLLSRFARDADICGLATQSIPEVKENECFVHSESVLRHKHNNQDMVFIEECDLILKEDDTWGDLLASWLDAPSNMQSLQKRLCIVHDDIMTYLLETSTEVITRIRIEDDTKAVAEGALWYEENLPTESYLYSLLHVTKPFDSGKTHGLGTTDNVLQTLTAKLNQSVLQLGGKSTVGRGLCRVHMVDKTSSQKNHGVSHA